MRSETMLDWKHWAAIGLLILVISATSDSESGPNAGSPRQDLHYGPSEQCDLRFEDLWNCETGEWGVTHQDTLYSALVYLQKEIPESADAIERRITGLCQVDMLNMEMRNFVISSGKQEQPIVCYLPPMPFAEIERIIMNSQAEELASQNVEACRRFYRERFFAGLLDKYQNKETNPIRAVCGEAFAAQRIGIYPKDLPEAVVIRHMMILNRDSCRLACNREIANLHSQRYLDTQKKYWVLTFEREAAQGKKDFLRRLFGRGMSLYEAKALQPLEFMANVLMRANKGVGRENRFSKVKIVEKKQTTADEVVLEVRYSGLPDIPKYEERDVVYLVRENGQWRIDR